MIHLLRSWWYARLRRIDTEILWPICKQNSRDIDHAREVLEYHALRDPAWLALGKENVWPVIRGLE